MAKDNYTKAKHIRTSNKCLCEDFLFKCENSKRHNTAKNHLISKRGYLERIAFGENVLVFDFENRDYKKNARKLTKRTIANANKFRVFCSKHDNYLFGEIENGNNFDENNKKQIFQFSFRAFVFSYSEGLLKNNREFDKIVDDFSNKVANAHLQMNKKRFKNYKNLIDQEDWSGVETEIIRLNRKCEFITCWSGTPNMGLLFPIAFTNCNISINIFPENNETIILLSYLKDDFSFGSRNFCRRLKNLSKSNEKKFIAYIEKFVVAFDHNIALNPMFWSTCSESDQKTFYEIAHMFPTNKTMITGLGRFFKLRIKKLKLELIH